MKFEFKIKIPKFEFVKSRVMPGLIVSGLESGKPFFKREHIHDAVQTHAFSLGYEWREKNDRDQKITKHWDKPALHLGSDGRIKYYTREKDFKVCDCASINWKEFLKLKG